MDIANLFSFLTLGAIEFQILAVSDCERVLPFLPKPIFLFPPFPPLSTPAKQVISKYALVTSMQSL